MDAISRRCLASVRYTGMRQPKFVEDHNLNMVMVHDHKGQQAVPTRLEKPLEIYVDGLFGSPSSNIYRAEHAVLVGTGIGHSLCLDPSVNITQIP